MENEKFFQLSKPIYHDCDVIRVTCPFDKSVGGYVIKVELVHFEFPRVYGKMFCKEYYETNGDAIDLVLEAGRRSKKKQEQMNEYLEENAKEYANKFLQHFSQWYDISKIEIGEYNGK